MKRSGRLLAVAAAALAICARSASAQSGEMWHWMPDGASFATFNHRDSDRGEPEFGPKNGIRGWGLHPLGPGQLFVGGMLSFEPMTVTPRGYSQLFQMGEAYNKLENIDRQHPHDFFSQLAAGWRVPLGSRGAGPVVLGPGRRAARRPVAFRHRLSASRNTQPP